MPRIPLLVAAVLGVSVVVAGEAISGPGGAVAEGVHAPVDGPRRHASLAAAATPRTLPRPRAIVCPLAPESDGLLPPTARRGLAHHLRQYPSPALATAVQRRAAARLLEHLRAAAAGWRDPRAAAKEGFATGRARRTAGDHAVHWLHAEHRLFSADRRFLDPRRPEALIYANAPGRPLVLVGAMFSMRRGLLGPTPGGPITRWHSHLVCVAGKKRGLAPRRDGSCPAGAARRQGSEMMHVWLTGDLRSAFAVHAPARELCAARVLRGAVCRGPAAVRAM